MNQEARPAVAYIGLGSNLGDRHAYLQEAIRRLNQADGVQVARTSAIYETEPVGYVEQPAFLNMAAALETTLSPHELLHLLHATEETLGRKREIRWGPRTIDLDLLLYGDVALDTPELTLPHPRMLERAFVLVPLLEVANIGCIPGLEDRLREHPIGKEGVNRWINTH